MANTTYFKVKNGIKVEPSTTAADEAGSIRVDSAASNALKYYDSAERTVVNTDGTQTLTNKTLSGNIATNLVSGAATVTLPTTTSTLATLALSETLTNKTITAPTITSPSIADATTSTPITIAEVATPATPASGFGKIYFKSDGFLYQLNDGGTESQVGAGSAAGGINYIDNPDAETDTTGWAAYADAAGTTPVDGTGGSPTVTITRTTTTPLRGTGSFLLTKDAANRQGEGVSYAFAIDSADKAKVLNVSFDYEIASGTFVSGDSSDIRVWIYDVTNTVLISVSPYTIQGGSSYQHKFTGTFQTASNSTSYRLIIHCATTSASAYTFEFDNVVVGPQVVNYGAPIGDWTAYTPSWSSGFGTVTGSAGFYRRVGDSVEVFATATTGTVAAALASISLPSVTIDTAKTSGAISDVGTWATNAAGSMGTMLTNTGTSATLVYFSDDTAASNGLTPSNGNAITGNTTLISVHFTVPVVGWSSTVLMSNDTDTRVVAARYESNTARNVANNSTTTGQWILEDKVFDTHNAFNPVTSTYTVPVPGLYKVTAMMGGFSADSSWGSGENTELRLYKDTVYNALLSRHSTEAAGGDTFTASRSEFGSALVSCVAGTVLEVRAFQDGGGTVTSSTNAYENWVSFERVSGPSAIAATESVNALYENSAATSITSGATGTTAEFACATKVFDSHNAYNTTTAIYTVPSSGKYRASGAFQFQSNNGWAATEAARLQLYKNGSLERTMAVWVMGDTVTGIVAAGSGSALASCVAGDTLEIRIQQNSGGSIALQADGDNNWSAFERIGN